MYVCMHACMCVCMHVFQYVCMYVCMYTCMYMYIECEGANGLERPCVLFPLYARVPRCLVPCGASALSRCSYLLRAHAASIPTLRVCGRGVRELPSLPAGTGEWEQ